MKYSAMAVTLNLALVQVHGETRVSASSKKHNRKLIPYTHSTLLSFLEDSFYGRKTVINMLVDEYTNTTAKAGCDEITLLDSAIEAINFCETDGEPVPITYHDFLFVGSVGEYLIFTCLFESHASHFRLPNSSSQHRCIEKPRQH
jgi:hypothetical protein